MNIIKLFTLILLVAVCFTVSAEAQRRRATRRAPAPKLAVTAPATSAEVTAQAQKVSIQIKNVTKFIYVLGGIAQGIEDIDKDSRSRKVAKATLDKNEANKAEVIRAIRNLRAGLNALETDFRTKPNLRKYLLQIEGISALSAQAEDSAAAGRFIDSGKPLLLVVEKLSDTLVSM